MGKKGTPAATVVDYNRPTSFDKQISVLDGGKFRPLWGGMVLCSPGLSGPKFRVSKQIWCVGGPTILSVCNTDLLTSETIRPNDLIKATRDTLLEKGGGAGTRGMFS